MMRFVLLVLLSWVVVKIVSRPVLLGPFEVESPSIHSKSRVEEEEKKEHQFSNVKQEQEQQQQQQQKTPLYIITPSSRPSLLSKSIFHVLPLQQCFDVHWIVVHTAKDKRISKAPLFRNVFPWITEIFTFQKTSKNGNHERNVGIDTVLSLNSTGLVYFLDDDNILPNNICQVQKDLSTEKMYYGDQMQCDNVRLNMDWMKHTFKCTDQGACATVDYTMQVNSGSFFVPVQLLKEYSRIRWNLDAYIADGLFFSDLVNAILQKDGTALRFERLPSSVPFRYNELNDENGCAQWRAPWSTNQLQESLQLYRELVDEMKLARKSFASADKMARSEVSFHNYVHILHVLRSLIDKPNATYVEIGVWKGGTSIFMSRHPLHTNVIGIDGFFFDHQLDEAKQFCQRLHGHGDIHLMKSDSRKAIPDLQKQLNGREIDILFIDGDHSEFGTRKDFELYSPLVANGGFVVFDDFMDTSYSGGVREAIMNLIRDGEISLEKYDVMGSVQNVMGAGPVFVDDPFFYDWQNVASNEYVLRKRT